MLSFPADRGAAATVAYACRNSNRNVFGEWVFGCQGTPPILRIKEENRQRVFRASPPVSSLTAYNTGAISKIFSMFSKRHRLNPVPSDICNPPFQRFVRM